MRLALAGVQGSGRTTLFRAFTGANAPAAAGPPGSAPVAVVKVADPRLERLRDLYRPRKYTPASVEVIDLPGLPPAGDDAKHQPQLLAAAREADGILLVVRAGKTQRKTVLAAQELLKKMRANVLGCVLTHVEYYMPGYHRYYHYYRESVKTGNGKPSAPSKESPA